MARWFSAKAVDRSHALLLLPTFLFQRNFKNAVNYTTECQNLIWAYRGEIGAANQSCRRTPVAVLTYILEAWMCFPPLCGIYFKTFLLLLLGFNNDNIIAIIIIIINMLIYFVTVPYSYCYSHHYYHGTAATGTPGTRRVSHDDKYLIIVSELHVLAHFACNKKINTNLTKK